MNSADHDASGWGRLAALWVGWMVDHLFAASTITMLVSLAVLVLTVLQIIVTVKKMRAVKTETDWGRFK